MSSDCPSCKGTGTDYRCKWCGTCLKEGQECHDCSKVKDDPEVFETSIEEIHCEMCDGYGFVGKETIDEIRYNL